MRPSEERNMKKKSLVLAAILGYRFPALIRAATMAENRARCTVLIQGDSNETP
jgi:hypothetical protein